jgi:RNA polymerase sigma factor (sigma-70 family)
LAAVPSIGRANRVEGAPAPEADLTRALFEEYAPQIFRYCLHQLGSREEAEDAVQSTFLNAFRGIKRGIVPEIESAWLFKIAHNVCLSRRRSSWRRDRVESPTDFDVVEELAPAPSRRADELIGLQDVLEQMPEQQRRAILLREWQGLSYREIGEELELSQAAVETLIFRARRSLAQGLEQPPLETTAKRKRMHAGALGNLLSSAQSFLLGGGAAVKIAAVVAVTSAGTVVATAPVHTHAPLGHANTPATPALTQQSTPDAGGTSGAVEPSAIAGGVQRLAPQQHAASHAVHVPSPTAPLVAPDPSGAGGDAGSTPTDPPAAPPTVVQPTVAPAPAPAPPAATGKGQDTPPGQSKKDDPVPAAGSNPAPPVGTGKDNAPGQQKKDDPAPADTAPSSPAAPSSDGNNGNSGSNGKDSAPGQQKKDDAPVLPTPTNGSTTGPPQGAAPMPVVQTPPASSDSAHGNAATSGDNGNAGGNGKGKGPNK